MTQSELNQRIAQATGEPLAEIYRLGFQVGMLEMEDVNFDDDLQTPGVIDWDELELHRNVAFFEQSLPLVAL